MKCCKSGYLVVGKPVVLNGIHYRGVDTDAWPIGTDLLEEWAPKVQHNASDDLTDLFLIDLESAIRYSRACANLKLEIRLLYCEVLSDNPSRNIPEEQTLPYTFLGYDYAYSGGDFFSAVLNDIVYQEGYFSDSWKNCLNGYGLFTELSKLQEFMQKRNDLIERYPCDIIVELGEFVVFRLFEINALHL